MASRWLAGAALILVTTGLAGCGSSDRDARPDAAKSAASALPSDLAEATSGDADLDGQADSGAGLTPAEFCGFLAKESPEVVDLQPAEYAAATFGGALLAFYTDKGLITDIDGADMDALVARGCPDATATLLPVLGASSFEDLLSR